jgi:hypothetical protein
VKELATLLRHMLSESVITAYALFGAIAQMRYTEAVATLDVDVLIEVPDPDRLDPLSVVYEFSAQHGYQSEGEAVRVGAWPVQFVPVFSGLTREAVEQAEEAELEDVTVRVVTAAHLAVIALSVGRHKDHLRVLSLLDAGSVARQEVARLADRHGLTERWQRFEARFLGD